MKRRKKRMLFAAMVVSICSVPMIVYANMAAPKEADIGTAITFEKNEEIAVVSEVLDITVEGDTAEIVATYHMKNMLDEGVSTTSMFLSPNIEQGEVSVEINQEEVSFVSESYALTNDLEVKNDGWQYAVLTGTDTEHATSTVDSITFEMEFSAQEEQEIVVSYSYQLGGYPNYDYNVKYGLIEYYLTPAATWQGFENLTINLYLDKDMPIIKESNLEFEKVGTRTYQYVSDTLPEEDLIIKIDENWWQNIFSTLRSPYLPMLAMMTSPIVIIFLVAVVVVWILLRRDKKKEK